ncbi:PEP-CTERM sorting domain-containing protein [Ideonella margarita]|uniref:PEP-CTERM sorting domain-containing protein n=1 Tax=Ideonella margarita TaxID=2984191 RepID=A0ABU9C7Y4_9BURK
MKIHHPAPLLMLSLLAALAAVPEEALAATVPAPAVNISTAQQANVGYAVASDDLLQTHLATSSFAGDFQKEGANGTVAFNNGIYGRQGNQGNGGESATADGSHTATFTFDTVGGQGYNLSAINTYAGWDGNRGGQAYVVSYATAAAPTTFIELATVFFNATTRGGNTNSRVGLTGSGGWLATNVQTVRFQFSNGLDYGYAGYRELDVFGVAAAAPVPEPSQVAMLLAGMGLLAARARRKRVA